MKRLLIVDDERIEREGIKKLLGTMDIELEILEAVNGKKALQTLKERHVDFMLTDMKMPVMSGMELIQAVRETDSKIQIAIFSGYGDFAFAKQAIRYDVTNYILKPVNPEEFKHTMSEMLEQSEAEEQKRVKKDQDMDFRRKYLFQKYLFTEKEEYLKRILTQEREFQPEINVAQVQNLMLVEAGSNFFEEHNHTIIRELSEHLGRKIGYLDLNMNQVLFVFVRSASDNYGRIAHDIHDFILKNYNEDCFLSVSRKIHNIKEAPGAYQELENQMEERFYLKDSRVFLPLDDVDGLGIRYTQEDYLKRVREDIKNKDFTRLWEDFRSLQAIICKHRQDSQMYVKFVFSELIKNLYDELGGGDGAEMREKIENIYMAESLSEICGHVELGIRAFERKYVKKEEGGRSDVEKVKQYISTHVEENLSTNRLAEQVYLSPGYLSYVFKKETGMNLCRYIKECRMEKAKELLNSTNMKIVQICGKVGFSNVSYFCQSFREYCGVSPEAYRRKGDGDEFCGDLSQSVG